MKQPNVKKGDWIIIGPSDSFSPINGYVIDVFEDSLGVGYYQNELKAIKDDVIWNGTHWEFKYNGPCGSYLRGQEESIVKHGPPR